MSRRTTHHAAASTHTDQSDAPDLKAMKGEEFEQSVIELSSSPPPRPDSLTRLRRICRSGFSRELQKKKLKTLSDYQKRYLKYFAQFSQGLKLRKKISVEGFKFGAKLQAAEDAAFFCMGKKWNSAGRGEQRKGLAGVLQKEIQHHKAQFSDSIPRCFKLDESGYVSSSVRHLSEVERQVSRENLRCIISVVNDCIDKRVSILPFLKRLSDSKLGLEVRFAGGVMKQSKGKTLADKDSKANLFLCMGYFLGLRSIKSGIAEFDGIHAEHLSTVLYEIALGEEALRNSRLDSLTIPNEGTDLLAAEPSDLGVVKETDQWQKVMWRYGSERTASESTALDSFSLLEMATQSPSESRPLEKVADLFHLLLEDPDLQALGRKYTYLVLNDNDMPVSQFVCLYKYFECFMQAKHDELSKLALGSRELQAKRSELGLYYKNFVSLFNSLVTSSICNMRRYTNHPSFFREIHKNFLGAQVRAGLIVDFKQHFVDAENAVPYVRKLLYCFAEYNRFPSSAEESVDIRRLADSVFNQCQELLQLPSIDETKALLLSDLVAYMIQEKAPESDIWKQVLGYLTAICYKDSNCRYRGAGNSGPQEATFRNEEDARVHLKEWLRVYSARLYEASMACLREKGGMVAQSSAAPQLTPVTFKDFSKVFSPEVQMFIVRCNDKRVPFISLVLEFIEVAKNDRLNSEVIRHLSTHLIRYSKTLPQEMQNYCDMLTYYYTAVSRKCLKIVSNETIKVLQDCLGSDANLTWCTADFVGLFKQLFPESNWARRVDQASVEGLNSDQALFCFRLFVGSGFSRGRYGAENWDPLIRCLLQKMGPGSEDGSDTVIITERVAHECIIAVPGNLSDVRSALGDSYAIHRPDNRPMTLCQEWLFQSYTRSAPMIGHYRKTAKGVKRPNIKDVTRFAVINRTLLEAYAVLYPDVFETQKIKEALEMQLALKYCTGSSPTGLSSNDNLDLLMNRGRAHGLKCAILLGEHKVVKGNIKSVSGFRAKERHQLLRLLIAILSVSPIMRNSLRVAYTELANQLLNANRGELASHKEFYYAQATALLLDTCKKNSAFYRHVDPFVLWLVKQRSPDSSEHGFYASALCRLHRGMGDEDLRALSETFKERQRIFLQYKQGPCASLRCNRNSFLRSFFESLGRSFSAAEPHAKRVLLTEVSRALFDAIQSAPSCMHYPEVEQLLEICSFLRGDAKTIGVVSDEIRAYLLPFILGVLQPVGDRDKVQSNLRSLLAGVLLNREDTTAGSRDFVLDKRMISALAAILRKEHSVERRAAMLSEVRSIFMKAEISLIDLSERLERSFPGEMRKELHDGLGISETISKKAMHDRFAQVISDVVLQKPAAAAPKPRPPVGKVVPVNSKVTIYKASPQGQALSKGFTEVLKAQLLHASQKQVLLVLSQACDALEKAQELHSGNSGLIQSMRFLHAVCGFLMGGVSTFEGVIGWSALDEERGVAAELVLSLADAPFAKENQKGCIALLEAVLKNETRPAAVSSVPGVFVCSVDAKGLPVEIVRLIALALWDKKIDLRAQLRVLRGACDAARVDTKAFVAAIQSHIPDGVFGRNKSSFMKELRIALVVSDSATSDVVKPQVDSMGPGNGEL